MNKQLITGGDAYALEIAPGITVTIAPDFKYSYATGAAFYVIANAHPGKDASDDTLAAYDVILRNFHPSIAAAAAVETVARVTFFPKVSEIAESARNILALITSAGMYARDEASRERVQKIRTWERDMLPATIEFIERAKADRLLRAEIEATRRAQHTERRELTAG